MERYIGPKQTRILKDMFNKGACYFTDVPERDDLVETPIGVPGDDDGDPLSTETGQEGVDIEKVQDGVDELEKILTDK